MSLKQNIGGFPANISKFATDLSVTKTLKCFSHTSILLPMAIPLQPCNAAFACLKLKKNL